jgi:two-component system KDP operon response regulator KdpE
MMRELFTATSEMDFGQSKGVGPLQGSVLIVEDELTLRRTLSTTLAALGFNIGEAATGDEALKILTMKTYEALLLDMNMPGLNGLETCSRIRALYPQLPVLMLTVRDSEDDKVSALDAGADDYITKPFQIRELIARIRSAIRRYRSTAAPVPDELVVGVLRLDRARRRVEREGVQVHLTPGEFNVLCLLMENAGKPLTHSKLMTTLRGEEHSENREYLRVVINNLRKKVEADPANPEYLLTETCVGYRLAEH